MQIFHSNDFILSGEGVNIICATPDVNVHAHEFYELVYVDSGCARHNVAGSVYDIGAGDLFLVDIGVEHSYSERSPDFSVINCLFMPAFLSNVVNNDSAFSELAETVFFKSFAHPDKPFFMRAGVVPGARFIIAQMLDEHKSKNNGYLQVIQALLKVLLIYALRAYSDDDGLRRHSKLADEIVDYVNKSGGRKIRVDEISQALFFSPAYISRVFKESTGVQLSKFIQDKRMDYVCRLLDTTDMTIENILSEAEYSDRKSFYEQFHKRFGCTPGEYRSREKRRTGS